MAMPKTSGVPMAQSTYCVSDATFQFPTLRFGTPQQNTISQMYALSISTPQRPSMGSRILRMHFIIQAAMYKGMHKSRGPLPHQS